VSVCELREPLGNLRQNTFWELWNGEKARARREKIACKECWCTTEVFLWPSFTYQPVHMLKTMLGGKVWRKPKPLDPKDKLVVKLEDAYGQTTEDGLKLAAVLAREAEARAAEQQVAPVRPHWVAARGAARAGWSSCAAFSPSTCCRCADPRRLIA
jgi:hypothetical protein